MRTAIYTHTQDDGSKIEYAVDYVVHKPEHDVGVKQWAEINAIAINDAVGTDVTNQITSTLFNDIDWWLQEEGMYDE